MVREQKESDWKPEDGTAFLRYINIEVVMFDVPRIHNLRMMMDEVWIKANRPDIDMTASTMSLSTHNSCIQHSGNIHSIEEFMNFIHPPESEEYGRFQKEKNFKDGYLLDPIHGRLKVHSLKVDYSVGPPLTQTVDLDGTSALLGVIEYVQKGVKKLVFEKNDVERVVTRRLG